ncbi:hypothetical protein BZA70DRAFT_161918 [Myxozyma melibiosi]|uniref:Uncharacterized protein n=1 Tax=Myxozyma melibiosi TaxID=54550 RepID=A0ABR1F6Q9_9ASCO
MNYLLARSLCDHRYIRPHDRHFVLRRNRKRTQICPPKPPLRAVSLYDIDSERQLLDHVVLGSSASFPFRLITLKPPNNALKGSDEFPFESDPYDVSVESALNSTDEIAVDLFDAGGVFLWELTKDRSRIDPKVAPRQYYPEISELTGMLILSAWSAWSLMDCTLLQVLFRCELTQPAYGYDENSQSGGQCHASGADTSKYDRELLEFRVGLEPCERVVICAGAGEFECDKSEVCYDLFDNLRLVAVSMNSRVVIYKTATTRDRGLSSRSTESGRSNKYWHPAPGLEVQYSSVADPQISIVELDYFVMDSYSRCFNFQNNDLAAAKAVKFEEFATSRLCATNTGYSVIFGALDTKSCLFVACSLLLNLSTQTISVQKLYRSNVSKYKTGLAFKFNVHYLLALALSSDKFGGAEEISTGSGRVRCNMKLLETYKRSAGTLQRIELHELDLVLQN